MGFGLMSAVLMKQQYDYRFGSLNPKNIYYNDVLNRAGTRNSPFLKKRRRKPQEVDYGFGGLVSAASSAIKTVAGMYKCNTYYYTITPWLHRSHNNLTLKGSTFPFLVSHWNFCMSKAKFLE